MTFLERIAWSLKLIKPNRKRIRRWAAHGEVIALGKVMKRGSFAARRDVLVSIRDFHVEGAYHLVKKALNDSVGVVALTSCDVLENGEIDAGLRNEIARIRTCWKEKLRQQRVNFKKSASGSGVLWTERHQRPSNKSFENVKQMLKKPMNIGKWM